MVSSACRRDKKEVPSLDGWTESMSRLTGSILPWEWSLFAYKVMVRFRRYIATMPKSRATVAKTYCICSRHIAP